MILGNIKLFTGKQKPKRSTIGKENAGNILKVFFSHLNELLPPSNKLSVDAADRSPRTEMKGLRRYHGPAGFLGVPGRAAKKCGPSPSQRMPGWPAVLADLRQGL